ncbi:N-6 DNA methylase [Rothia sp. AR01]|uniref:site-specific DNA-methyltransferase (adenine-specific) n=1 Tax=Rothia santali TaxID=2949643 RepID=A0A9X2KH42_9MICC|nr:N-6 DNA methylase [Rothia santali]MCP3424823.1 N-6 DNA methylase [Rothia santali]
MAEPAESSRKTTARIVWDTADKYLRNIVHEEDYGNYILPFAVLRRLECMLADRNDDVIKYVNSFAGMSQHLIDIAVKDRFGLGFYNTSPLDLPTIALFDDNVDKSLKSHIDGFSNNISDIWVSFDFNRRAKVFADANRLHPIVKHLSTLDLSPASLNDTNMGDVFEGVMYRAFNKKGEATGNFYTPRDAIRLMVNVPISNDDDTFASDHAACSVYDSTAGSGGMQLIAQETRKRTSEQVDVTFYGQELMPSPFALGKADLLIQGSRSDAIKKGNSLVDDLYDGQAFDHVFSNLMFEVDWEVEKGSLRDADPLEAPPGGAVTSRRLEVQNCNCESWEHLSCL